MRGNLQSNLSKQTAKNLFNQPAVVFVNNFQCKRSKSLFSFISKSRKGDIKITAKIYDCWSICCFVVASNTKLKEDGTKTNELFPNFNNSTGSRPRNLAAIQM